MSLLALTLHQPWATLLVHGQKRIETRSWDAPATALGKPVIVTAAKGLGPGGKRELARLCSTDPFAGALQACGIERIDDLPLGAAIGTVVLERCVTMTTGSIERLFYADPKEYAFGHYEPGRYAWVTGHPAVLRKPVPVPLEPGEDGRRRQRLWHPAADVVDAVRFELTLT